MKRQRYLIQERHRLDALIERRQREGACEDEIARLEQRAGRVIRAKTRADLGPIERRLLRARRDAQRLLAEASE